MRALAQAIAAKRQGSPCLKSIDNCAAETGISRSTFYRIQTGTAVSLNPDNYTRICQWLGVNVSHFMPAFQAQPEPTTLDLIDDALTTDPTLSQAARFALSDLMRNTYRVLQERT